MSTDQKETKKEENPESQESTEVPNSVDTPTSAPAEIDQIVSESEKAFDEVIQAPSTKSSEAVPKSEDLDKIMNDIEELQDGMADVVAQDQRSEDALPHASSQELHSTINADLRRSPDMDDPSEELKGSTEEHWLGEETFSQLKKESFSGSTREPDTEGTLVMTVLGNLSFRFKHDKSGQEIEVGFIDDSVRIVLEDGTELKFPLVARLSPVGRAS